MVTRSDHGTFRAIRVATPVLAALVPMVFPPEAFPQHQTVTFTKHVAPILQQNCVRCHRLNSIAPMSLRTYQEVRPFAPLIKEMVRRRLMPPYHYDHDLGIQELKNDWRLSDDAIATIVAWVDAGAPQGDPGDMPPQREFPPYNDWMLKGVLGRGPDHVIESKPFTVPAEGGDLWWRPVVPVGLETDRKVKAIETRPSFPAGVHVVHHAIPRLLLKNEKGEWDVAATFSEYAMGKVGEIIPGDAYRVLPKDGLIQWDAHYYPPGHVVKDDVVKVGFWFYQDVEAPKYAQDLKLYPLQGDIALAPGGTAMTQGFHRWDHPVRLDAFQAHGHVHLHAMSAQAVYPDGRVELLSMVTNFSAMWHHTYIYEDHASPLLPTGTVLVLTGWYDNTEKNPLAPDPSTWVARGSRTTDEMSHAWIAVTHLDEEGYQRLTAERKQRQVAGSPEDGRR